MGGCCAVTIPCLRVNVLLLLVFQKDTDADPLVIGPAGKDVRKAVK